MSTDVPLELGDVAVQGHKESSPSIALLHAAALRAKPPLLTCGWCEKPCPVLVCSLSGAIGCAGLGQALSRAGSSWAELRVCWAGMSQALSRIGSCWAELRPGLPGVGGENLGQA